MPRCAGRKEDGSPCERIVGASHTYCYSHDPKRAAERRPNASRGGRSKANAEIGELKAQLKKLAADVLSGEVDRAAATAVNQIINSQARLLELERKIKETEELEARLEALETVLKARRSGWAARRGWVVFTTGLRRRRNSDWTSWRWLAETRKNPNASPAPVPAAATP